MTSWETVIGLEVHAELATETKMFSGCPNQFGDEPNTNIDPVTLGLPGSLPVLNGRAVELAVRLGLAVHCRVQRCVFARKNYFYPDMPKNFQISQYDLPLNEDGWLELIDGTRIGIERAHLEEDTGKTTHVGGGGRIHDAEYSLVDYNRAGVPLLEIVSRPDLRSAEQASEYVSELRSILVAVGASDGKMEEGSLRVDANISVRRSPDDPLGTRCEVKNVNSLRSLVRAIEYEARRQIDLIEAGESVEQQTRHWNDDEGRTSKMRSKEDTHDYRYFPEPDLVPFEPSDEWIEQIRTSLPALPSDRRQRLADAAAVSPTESAIAVDRGLDDLAIGAIEAGADGARVLTHVDNNLAVAGASDLSVEHFAALVKMETAGELSSTQTKQVLAEMVETGRAPADIAAAHGFEAMDTDELDELLDQVIADHPDDWADYAGGNDKAANVFIGAVMKATRGQADGKIVTEKLRQRAT
ncbi:MAG TPA: Asp-tRNA(Asn)/Glu-tRNA(Gln) amidotransferase subunit GatB [Acidimicrobiales bacterium]|nr:Asp-tRNA(Asn)/Glu-tRNA(Gln) amidotransferase subunit GatB [Acidimicrobiales bacterium]